MRGVRNADVFPRVGRGSCSIAGTERLPGIAANADQHRDANAGEQRHANAAKQRHAGEPESHPDGAEQRTPADDSPEFKCQTDRFLL